MNTASWILSSAKYFLSQTKLLRIAAAILIFLFFLILRRVFAKYTVKFLNHCKSISNSQPACGIIRSLEAPVRLLFIVVGLSVSVNIIGLPDGSKAFMNHIIRTIIIFSVFLAVYGNSHAISVVFQKFFKNTGSDAENLIIIIFSSGIRFAIIFITCTITLQEWGYDIAGLLAGLGLGGLAFALAAKDTVSNLFGGIIIMIDKPFSIGDWICTSRVEGIVEYIGFRSTRIRTFEQALVTVPNSIMSSEPITNCSRMGKRKMTFRLGITYEATAEQLKECIKQIRTLLEEHPDIHPETVMVYFDKFGEGKQDILVCLFTRAIEWQDYLEVQQDINFKIMNILNEMGIVGSNLLV